jgi:endo-1,4-beta-xylanase
MISFLMVGLLATNAAIAQEQPTLKEAFKGKFLIGVALNAAQFAERDERGAAIAKTQFNSISPENVLKWEAVHPQPDKYDFEAPDRYVAFGEKNTMAIIGHTLVWHYQTPRWVFEDAQGKPTDRETLLKRLHDHIQTVVGRYKGRIKGWDVVNEALNEDGTLRQSPWMKIIGEDFLLKAYEYAHEADPQAELYYNDFSLENAPKREGAIALVKKLQSQGVHIAGVGLQGHYKMDWPRAGQLDTTIQAFAQLGVKVMITELDMDVLPAASMDRGADVGLNIEMNSKLNPYAKGLPDSVQKLLAHRYADLFAILVKNSASVGRVTFWCVTDGDSWLNNWPVRGRTNYPLLFDRSGKPKPAFDAVVSVALKR